MRPEERQGWEQGPAPVWDREGVWRRIAARRARQRRQLVRRRLGVAASLLLVIAAGGAGAYTLATQPQPQPPGEVLPMMKDRVLDDSIAPEGDTLLRFVPAPPPAGYSD